MRRAWRQDMQRRAIFGGGRFGAREIVAVGLVDGDHIGEFDDAFFEPLHFIAAAGQHHHQEKIGHVGDRNLRLADADRFDQYHVVARRLAQQHGFARLGGDASEGAGRGEGRMNALASFARCAMRVFRQESIRRCAATRDRPRARRPCGLVRQHAAQRIDHGRFADARRAGNADAHRVAGACSRACVRAAAVRR